MDHLEELIIASLKELLELRSIKEVDSNSKSKLVYPLKRDGTRRISKQEAKLIFIKHIEQYGEYHYSVEAPTRKQYLSTGAIPMLGSIDVCLYENDDRKHMVEFLTLNPKQTSYSKVFEKLFSDEEGLDNYFIQILQKTNKSTFMNVENKYTEAIESVREKYNEFNSRLKIFLCDIGDKKISMYEIDGDGKLGEPEEVFVGEEL